MLTLLRAGDDAQSRSALYLCRSGFAVETESCQQAVFLASIVPELIVSPWGLASLPTVRTGQDSLTPGDESIPEKAGAAIILPHNG